MVERSEATVRTGGRSVMVRIALRGLTRSANFALLSLSWTVSSPSTFGSFLRLTVNVWERASRGKAHCAGGRRVNRPSCGRCGTVWVGGCRVFHGHNLGGGLAKLDFNRGCAAFEYRIARSRELHGRKRAVVVNNQHPAPIGASQGGLGRVAQGQGDKLVAFGKGVIHDGYDKSLRGFSSAKTRVSPLQL